MNTETEPWLPLRALAGWAVAISVGFVVVGVAWPSGADILLRVLLATLVAGFVGALAYRTIRSVAQPRLRSPFERDQQQSAPAIAPQGLRRLAAELRAANDERSARRVNVPYSAQRAVAREAAWRLAEHHGLQLDDPTHHDLIRQLVGADTWKLISPLGTTTGADPVQRGRTRQREPVRMDQLGRILDDLERL